MTVKKEETKYYDGHGNVLAPNSSFAKRQRAAGDASNLSVGDPDTSVEYVYDTDNDD